MTGKSQKKALFLAFCLWFGFAPLAEAGDYYPDYWQDKNCILIWGHQGIAWYLDKKSIKVKTSDPPYYIITVTLHTVSDAVYKTPEFEPKYAGSGTIEIFLTPLGMLTSPWLKLFAS